MRHKLMLRCLAVVLLGAASNSEAVWDVQQITNNNKTDYGPAIYKNQIAWQSRGEKSAEIFFWDGQDIHQITNNEYMDKKPSIHKGQITWREEVNPDSNTGRFEVMLYQDGVIKQVTNNKNRYFYPGEYGYPVIYNGQVAWREWDVKDSEIFFFDGTWNPDGTAKIINISDNDVPDWAPSIYDGKVAWKGYSPDYTKRQISLWDGVKTNIIFEEEHRKDWPFINNPSLYKDTLAFSRYDGSDFEIYYWNGSSLLQVTDNDRDDYGGAALALYNGGITWNAWDGNDLEIYYWKNGKTAQITDNTWDDKMPVLWGNQIAWMGKEQAVGDYEIFMATQTAPEPASILLVGGGLLGLVWNRKRKG